MGQNGDERHLLIGEKELSLQKQMPHMPTKEKMIAAVKKSGCPNLHALPLADMSAEQIYLHLLASKCPCLQRLLRSE
jgi:hypothetical protein